jgi:hypothetical protein
MPFSIRPVVVEVEFTATVGRWVNVSPKDP